MPHPLHSFKIINPNLKSIFQSGKKMTKTKNAHKKNIYCREKVNSRSDALKKQGKTYKHTVKGESQPKATYNLRLCLRKDSWFVLLTQHTTVNIFLYKSKYWKW